MKVYDNGTGFTVSYNHMDASDFADQWPGFDGDEYSSGWYAFENNGDLVDMSDGAIDNEAFMDDCKQYGEERIDRIRSRKTKKVKESVPIRETIDKCVSSLVEDNSSRNTRVTAKSGLDGWQGKLQDQYNSYDEWFSFSRTYGLAKRLGFTSARQAWEANPTIQGSVLPSDFRRVR